MRTRLLVPLATLPLLIAAPAFATVTPNYDSAGLTYSATGDGAADAITITCVGDVVSPDTDPIDAVCSTLKTIYVAPGDGIDAVSLAGVTPASFPNLVDVSIYTTSDGVQDTITGSGYADTITAEGVDIVFGGPGNDFLEGGKRVEGGDGNDTFFTMNATEGAFGGAGDDRFVNTINPGGTDGGPGDDTMEVDFNTVARVVDLSFVFGPDTLKATAPGQDVEFALTGIEHLIMAMPEDGANTVDLRNFPGDGLVNGHGGPDTIIGSMKTDILRGGTGNDTIDAQDGGFDVVSCGDGTDTAKADAVDVVTGCETVTLPPVPATDTSAIAGPKKVVRGKKAKFTFSSIPAGATFQCAVDKKAFKACTSPFTVKTKKLALGKHTLQVKAAGDATPSMKKFKVKKP